MAQSCTRSSTSVEKTEPPVKIISRTSAGIITLDHMQELSRLRRLVSNVEKVVDQAVLCYNTSQKNRNTLQRTELFHSIMYVQDHEETDAYASPIEMERLRILFEESEDEWAEKKDGYYRTSILHRPDILDAVAIKQDRKRRKLASYLMSSILFAVSLTWVANSLGDNPPISWPLLQLSIPTPSESSSPDSSTEHPGVLSPTADDHNSADNGVIDLSHDSWDSNESAHDMSLGGKSLNGNDADEDAVAAEL
ncbi:hypothetical protein FRC09_001224 [Ceratobasidium sp. 395]|nr:hypothetical protein FRC09_001224 [Ceratobasidium sp. 395]